MAVVSVGPLSLIKFCRPTVRPLSATRVAQCSMEGQCLSVLHSVTTDQQALPRVFVTWTQLLYPFLDGPEEDCRFLPHMGR